MYKFYKDKSENFKCNVKIEGAPLSKAKARLVLENSEFNIVFEGIIDSNGDCNVNVKKLNILPEGLTGNLKLEIIVENDAYFVPYQSDFIVAQSRKVTVESVSPQIENKKAIVEVKPSVKVTEVQEVVKKNPVIKPNTKHQDLSEVKSTLKKIVTEELRSILLNKKKK